MVKVDDTSGLSSIGVISFVIIFFVVFGMVFYIYNSSKESKLETMPQPKVDKIQITDSPLSPAEIQITNKGFFPATIVIAKDQKVVWVNKDTKVHEVLSTPNSSKDFVFDSLSLGPNDTFGIQLNFTGVIKYKDSKEPQGFTGEIVVK